MWGMVPQDTVGEKTMKSTNGSDHIRSDIQRDHLRQSIPHGIEEVIKICGGSWFVFVCGNVF
jgi:hypothetical protein